MSSYWPPNPQFQDLIRAALRSIHADHYEDEHNPHLDAEREYSAEQLALAARELVRAVDALPADQQPIGWTEQPGSPQDAGQQQAGAS